MCFSLDCWQWSTMTFVAIVGLEPGLYRSYHGVPVVKEVQSVSFRTNPAWPCFPLYTVIGKVEELAYNAWIVLFKYSLSGSPLIMGRVLMANLATISLIFFGFNIVEIVGLLFRASMFALSFVGGVVGYGWVIWFWNSWLRQSFFPVRSEDNTCILKSSVANLDITYIMIRDLPFLVIWFHRKFTSRYLCQWRTRISQSLWRSVHGSMHHDIRVFTVHTQCILSFSFESVDLSRGYWDPCPCVPFLIPFYYLEVACALGFPFPLYFWMALVIFLLGWAVAVINEHLGQYIHRYQAFCFSLSSGTSPILSALETPPTIVSKWCSLPYILQTGFNPSILKTLGTGTPGVN